MKFAAPNDVTAYLQAHRSFDYDPSSTECGAVGLVSPEDLTLRDFWVNGEDRDWTDDPHAADDGCYVVPGIDLVGEIDGFDPDGILLWIPELVGFGSWDCDHWDLIVFGDTSWDEIVADPVRYLDAQWDPACSFEYLKPWTAGFEWRAGRPL